MPLISRLLALFVLAAPLSALQLGAGRFVSRTPIPLRHGAEPICQFGGGEPERKQLTRATEPDEYFKTNMGTCARANASTEVTSFGASSFMLSRFSQPHPFLQMI